MAISDTCTCDFTGPAKCDAHRGGDVKLVMLTSDLPDRGVTYTPARMVKGVVSGGKLTKLHNPRYPSK